MARWIWGEAEHSERPAPKCSNCESAVARDHMREHERQCWEFYWASTNEEVFHDGPYATREDAIAEMLAAYPDPNTQFYVGKGERLEAATLAPDAKEILERISERAYDEIGEAAMDWPEENKVGMNALTDAIKQAVAVYEAEYCVEKYRIVDVATYIVGELTDKEMSNGKS